MNQYNTNHQNPQNKGDNHQLITFNFENNNVRIFQDENGQPLFVAKDVATILGYKDTVSAIKQFCKGVVKHHPLITNGGNQNVRVIYEPDLYRLTFGSKLESAVRFQNWIYEEVLPTIRKTGSYAVQPQVAIPTDYEQAIEHLLVQIKQNKQLAVENQTLKPKADAYDRFLDSDGLMTSGVIGKLLGYKSAQEFNDAIHAKGVAFKSSGVWQFYASFKDKHIGKMVGWEREEFNKAGVTLKWKTVAIDYFSSLLGRPVVQKELLDA